MDDLINAVRGAVERSVHLELTPAEALIVRYAVRYLRDAAAYGSRLERDDIEDDLDANTKDLALHTAAILTRLDV